MLNKFNTFARLVIVGLLIFPIPVYADSHIATETETFDGTDGALVTDLTVPSGTLAIDSDDVSIRNDQNCCGIGGQYFFSLKDNYIGNPQATPYTFTLPSDHDIIEIGFRMAGVNYAYTIKYNYSDDTNETINKDAQSGSSYEDITKTITGKYLVSFVVTVSDWVGIDSIFWKYDSTITTTTTSTTTTLSPLDIERNNNFTETGVLETDDERVDREFINALDWERDYNQAETGYWELDSERRDRETAEEEARLKAEEESRLEAERIEAEIEAERLAEEQRIAEESEANEVETGFYETNVERADREAREYQEMLDKNFAETGYYETDDERLAREDAEEEAKIKAEIEASLEESLDLEVELDEEELEELIDTIQDIKENVDFEELKPEIEVIEIKEVDVEDIIVALTPITTTTTTTTTLPSTEELNTLTEEEQKVVQNVVDTIVRLESLTEKEQEVISEIIGVATEELEIVAVLIKDEPSVAQAVLEFVERASKDDSEDYTLADSIVEVQAEKALAEVVEFFADPIGTILNIEIKPIKLKEIREIGNDQTTDSRKKSQEIVLPIILVSQIIAGGSIIPIRKIK